VGVAKTRKGESTIEVVVPMPERNVNAAYEDAIDVLLTKPPKEEKMVDTVTAQEDYYREFSTRCATSIPHACCH
jgi:chitin synthase